MRNILLNWHKISEGDVSIVRAVLREPGSLVGTVVCTPHWVVWNNLVRLGWAEEVDIPQPETLPRKPAFFKLTQTGQEYLPRFIARYELAPQPDTAIPS